MHRREFLRGTVGAALVSAFPLRAQGERRAPPLPHLVLILADDMGYGDPRCYNPDSRIPTPFMDRLAAEGIRFTDAHTPSSVCTPTRYGLLTGRYCWRTRLKSGVLNGYSPALIEPGRMTLASLLKQHGYVTACIGKWHLGLGEEEPTDFSQPLRPGPLEAGFDTFFGIAASLDMPPYVFIENDRVTEAPTDYTEGSKPRREGGGGFWRAGAIAPHFRHEEVLPTLTGRAVRFIEERATKPEQPFFLYLALTAPHTPWMPTAEFRGKSGAGYYGDFVAQVDWSIGQVMEALERCGLAGNTLLIVTSDNGAHWLPKEIEEFGHRANGPWRGQKADIHEGGHRVPFIARWPGKIPPGAVSNEVICLTDLLATVAALLGTSLPSDAGEDSFNILPALLGQPDRGPLREATVFHSGSGMFAIRQGPWKLILGLGSGGFTPPREVKPKPGEPEGQLYNLEEDPQEQRNLYSQRPDIVAHLKALLETYRQRGHSR